RRLHRRRNVARRRRRRRDGRRARTDIAPLTRELLARDRATLGDRGPILDRAQTALEPREALFPRAPFRRRRDGEPRLERLETFGDAWLVARGDGGGDTARVLHQAHDAAARRDGEAQHRRGAGATAHALAAAGVIAGL